MSLRDDLIAAKALIDTPDKWRRGWTDAKHRWVGPLAIIDALIIATNARPYAAFPLADALHEALPDPFNTFGQSSAQAKCEYELKGTVNHADVMSLFDRAIASAQHEGHGETA